jgi:hypothetical protein
MEPLARPRDSLIPSKQYSYCQVAQANVSDGVAHNICYQRNKVLVLCDQIRSLHTMSQCVVTSDESMDHVDDFIEQFKKKGVSFCCLYHHEEEDDTG